MRLNELKERDIENQKKRKREKKTKSTSSTSSIAGYSVVRKDECHCRIFEVMFIGSDVARAGPVGAEAATGRAAFMP